MSSKTAKSRAAAVLARVRALPKETGGAFAALPASEDYLTRKPLTPSMRAAQVMVGAFGNEGRLVRLANDLDRLRSATAVSGKSSGKRARA